MDKQTSPKQQNPQYTLPPNSILIGKGSFSEVYKVTEQSKTYAIKKISKLLIHRQGRQKQLNREIQISKKIQHQNIIKFYECLQDSKYYYLKMEFFQGKNLRKYLLSEEHLKLLQEKCEEAKYMGTKICLDYICAFAEVRSQMVSNRDIKPDNILIAMQEGELKTKMIDFGEARFNITDALTIVGTNGYMAPEIYFGHGFYGEECDMWSLGQTFYEIFEGTRCDSCQFQYLGSPFRQNFRPKNKNDFDQYYERNIFEGINLCKGRTPGPFRQIIRQLLYPNPKQRLTFNEMLQILLKRFVEIENVLKSKSQRVYEHQRLIKNIQKQKQMLYKKSKLKQSIQKISYLKQLFTKLQPQPQPQSQSQSQVASQSQVSTQSPVLPQSMKKQENILLFAIYLQIQKQMTYISEVMMISVQQMFQEILLKIVDKDQFQYITNACKDFGTNSQYQGLTIQMKAYINKKFQREAQTVINKIKQLIPN